MDLTFSLDGNPAHPLDVYPRPTRRFAEIGKTSRLVLQHHGQVLHHLPPPLWTTGIARPGCSVNGWSSRRYLVTPSRGGDSAAAMRLCGQAGRGSGAYRLVPADQGECPGEAAEGGIGREVLLDLFYRRPAAKALEVPDQLDVGEVAGGERVGIAAAVEAKALDRPGPDLRDREQPTVGGRIAQVGPATSHLPRAAHHRNRATVTQVHRLELGGDRKSTR